MKRNVTGSDGIVNEIKKLRSGESNSSIEELKTENDNFDTLDTRETDETVTSESPQSADKSVSTVTYSVDGPFLRVHPYWFDYCSWAKGRWFTHPLISVFRREFRDRPAAYYSHACQAGLIRVNDVKVGEDYVVKQGDRIQHRIHRHEPLVLATPEPEILHVGEGLLVVAKPPSIPMHPSGRYRHNTLTAILQHRHPDLFPTGHISCVNRLDRLVSGIVILSRSAEKADELRRAMQEKKFRKFYLAQVAGDFGEDAADGLEKFSYATKSQSSGVIECEAPLLIVEHKLGLSCVADSKVHPAAKPSHTRFIKLAYDPSKNLSLVLCEPVTGRTHQIRLHLQYLGYPIHNDPLYNNSFWRQLQSSSSNDEIYKSSDWLTRVKAMAQEMSKSSLYHQEDADNFDYDATTIKSDSTALCPDCENPLPDPSPSALRIDLHAYKYSGPMGSFSTSLPDWAVQGESKLAEAEGAFNSFYE